MLCPSTDTEPSLVDDCGFTRAASGAFAGCSLSCCLPVSAATAVLSSRAATAAARGSLRMGEILGMTEARGASGSGQHGAACPPVHAPEVTAVTAIPCAQAQA